MNDELLCCVISQVNSIQIMIWAVKACDGTFSDQVERLVDRVHRKVRTSSLRQHHMQHAQIKTQTSWATPPKNPVLVLPCTATGDVEMATVGSNGGTQESTGQKGPASTSNRQASLLLPSPPRPPSPAPTHRMSTSSASTSSLASRVVPILPEFKTLLLPLEPHFVEVQKFVAAVLVYLSSAMDRITDWKPALRAFYAPSTELPLFNKVFDALGRVLQKCKDSRRRRSERSSERSTGSSDTEDLSEGQRRRTQQRTIDIAVQRASGALGKLTALTQARHAAQLGSIDGEFPHRVYEHLTHGKDDVFHMDRVRELYLRYQALVEDLQRSLTSDVLASDQSGDQDSDTAGESSESPEHRLSQPHSKVEAEQRRIPSNREVVIVNTLLASTQQLIAALHGLTTLVSRLQAHRDIRVTQDGKNA